LNRIVAALPLLAAVACAHPIGALNVRPEGAKDALEVELFPGKMVVARKTRVLAEVREGSPGQCGSASIHLDFTGSLQDANWLGFKLCRLLGDEKSTRAVWQLAVDPDARENRQIPDGTIYFTRGAVTRFEVGLLPGGKAVRVVLPPNLSAEVPLPDGALGDEVRRAPHILTAGLAAVMTWPANTRFEVVAK
jgi:hypothetical protein